jgi:ribonucleoside-triphosphate reductase (thioredoxin)
MSLPTPYQDFIHLSRYSRWLENEKRRETWEETVARYFKFFEARLKDTNGYTLPKQLKAELQDAIVNLEIMPSMRSMMTAGEALARDNTAGYNCAYMAINRVRAFDELLYILLCGTGVGFSVEKHCVERLPTIAEEFSVTETEIMVEDSKAGWAKAYKELVSLLIAGQIPRWNLKKIRPAGARLKTFGGRASGPAPLDDLFTFTVDTFKRAAGRKLTSIECHDLVCKIAEVVVVGGVRRSALISLSNLADEKMRDAKIGQWWVENPQRALSNNSVIYEEKPEIGVFMDEWVSLYKSKSGERGIFNREAAKKTVEKLGDRRDANYEWGCNPCSEILLRDREFCNLTEVVVRATDTEETLTRKIRLATILGTFQATLTYFPYLSAGWKKNCEEEALLGVSLTGILDSPLLRANTEETKQLLTRLRESTIVVNKEYAKKIGINPAAAITTVKPSGTISQLVDSSSGIHARHSEYYVRTVRADNKDPLCQLMKEEGFPSEQCVMRPDHTTVFSFPVKSPEGCVTRDDMTALEHLELWLTYQRYWTEHKPSITITVKEDEWMEVGAWVYKHFDEISGISFLPHTNHSYRQAPYQECTKEEHDILLARIPTDVDWNTSLLKFEKEDTTAGSQSYACTGDKCEVVDLV